MSDAASGFLNKTLATCTTIMEEFLASTTHNTASVDASALSLNSPISTSETVPSYAMALEGIFEYPQREARAASRFLLSAREALEAVMEKHMYTVSSSSTPAGKAPHVSDASDATSDAAAPTVVGGPKAAASFLHLEHRSERLAFVGGRVLDILNALLPPQDVIEGYYLDVVAALDGACNPFAFPDECPTLETVSLALPLSAMSAKASTDTSAAQHSQEQSLRDVDILSSSQLMQLFRSLSCSFSRETLNRLTAFEQTRFITGSGSSTADAQITSLQLDGAPFHGGMLEVRKLWSDATSLLYSLSMCGCMLRSAMTAQRAHRASVVQLFERGCFDDALDTEADILGAADGAAAHSHHDDVSNISINDICSESRSGGELLVAGSEVGAEGCVQSFVPLLNTATTRLQMNRLARLVGTCRALDASGAESALKRIHFEQDRRTSMHENAVFAAASSVRRSTVNFVDLGDSGANAASMVFSACGRQQHGDTPCDSSVSQVFSPHQTSAAQSVHRSIIPMTTLMDLEMIARAYRLEVPSCTLPKFELLSSAGDAASVAHARMQLLLKLQRRRNTVSDSDETVRLKQLYPFNRRDAGIATEECLVVARTDTASQTHLVGAVYEEALVKDVEHELDNARTTLSSKVQQLMLERHRSEALLTRLEAVQKLRQDKARKAAAAGGTGALGMVPSMTAAGPDTHDGGSPTRVSSRHESFAVASRGNSPMSRSPTHHSEGEATDDEDHTSQDVPESAVERLLAKYRQLHPALGGAVSPPRAQHGKDQSSLATAKTHPATVKSPQSTVGPISKKFTLVGRLQRPQSSPPQDSTTVVPRNVTSGTALAESVPTASRRQQDSTTGAPARGSLEKQFGKEFATKLRSLDSNEKSCFMEVHRTSDRWTGKSGVESVVVPVGVDPRHARNFAPPLAQSPGYAGGEGESFGRTSAARVPLKAAHYATVPVS